MLQKLFFLFINLFILENLLFANSNKKLEKNIINTKKDSHIKINEFIKQNLLGYKIWGPFQIPEGAFFDFSSHYLKSKDFITDGGYSGFNFDFDGGFYAQLPVLYLGAGLYFIEFFCNSNGDSKIFIDSSIDLQIEINGLKIDKNIDNFDIKNSKSNFKVIIKGDFSYKTPLKIDIYGAICGYEIRDNSEIKNSSEKSGNISVFIKNSSFKEKNSFELNRDIDFLEKKGAFIKSDKSEHFPLQNKSEIDKISSEKLIELIALGKSSLSIYDILQKIEANPEIIKSLKKYKTPNALKIIYEWEKTDENLLNWHKSEQSFDSYRKVLELKLEENRVEEAKIIYWEIINRFFKKDNNEKTDDNNLVFTENNKKTSVSFDKSYIFFTPELQKASKLFDFKRYIHFLEKNSEGFDIDLQLKYLEYLALNSKEMFKNYLSELEKKYPQGEFLEKYKGVEKKISEFAEYKITKKTSSTTKELSDSRDLNKILLKEIILEKNRDKIDEFRRYIYSVADIHNFFYSFFPPKESEILEINSYYGDEKIEISPKFIQNNLLISKVKNGSILEIIYKIEHKKEDFYLFLQERYFYIDKISIKTDKNLTLSKINFQFLKKSSKIYEQFINSNYILEVENLKKYEEEPFSPQPHKFLPYILINRDKKYSKSLDYKYFFLSKLNSIKKHENSNIIKKILTIDNIWDIYQFLQNDANTQKINFDIKKGDLLYFWAEKKGLNPQYILVCFDKNSFLEDICSHQITYIPKENQYIDLEYPNHHIDYIPSHLNGKKAIFFNKNGDILYKNFINSDKSKYLLQKNNIDEKNSKFKTDNRGVFTLKVDETDIIEGKAVLNIGSFYKTNPLSVFNKLNEEEQSLLVEQLLKQMIPNSILSDFNIIFPKNSWDDLIIELDFLIELGIDGFRTNGESFVIINNIIPAGWSSLFTSYSHPFKYNTLTKRDNPLEINYFSESTTVNVQFSKNYTVAFENEKNEEINLDYIKSKQYFKAENQIFHYQSEIMITPKVLIGEDYKEFYEIVKKLHLFYKKGEYHLFTKFRYIVDK